jgi:hypothetical protein
MLAKAPELNWMVWQAEGESSRQHWAPREFLTRGSGEGLYGGGVEIVHDQEATTREHVSMSKDLYIVTFVQRAQFRRLLLLIVKSPDPKMK